MYGTRNQYAGNRLSLGIARQVLKRKLQGSRAGDQQNIQSELYRQPAVARKESDPNAVPGARGSADEFCRAARVCGLLGEVCPAINRKGSTAACQCREY